MAAIIRNEFSTAVVAAFMDKFGAGSATTNNLFVTVGQPLPWTSSPWVAVDDLTPPNPDGSILDKTEAEKYAIVAKRVPGTNVQMVIPKVVWVTGTEYNLFDGTLADPYAATDWYIINSLGEVFICVTDPGPGNASTVEPLKSTVDITANGFGTTGALVDGYNWEFMYTVSGTAAIAQTNAWIPVNYGLGVNLAADDNPLAFQRLGVDNVMIIAEIDSTINFVGDDYRQIALYRNLVESNGTTIAAANKYEITTTTWQGVSSENELAGLVGLAESDMIYLENRTPILRSATQIEELKIVLSMG